MREVVMWEADDGSLHRSADAAFRKDQEAEAARRLEAMLVQKPRSGWVYQPEAERFKRRLVEECLRFGMANDFGPYGPETLTAPDSSASRVMSERGGPLGRLWDRAVCIDRSGREWQQVWLRNNPEKALKEFPKPER